MSVDYQTGEITTASLGPLAAALAKAQTAFPTVTRSKTVRVQTKTGGAYTFSYAPLDVIIDAVRKPLADNGLAIAQLIDRDELVTMLLHESGAALTGRAALPNSIDVQAFGSAITYLRRYAIQALLGIAAEEDDDGNHSAGNAAENAPRATGKPAAPQQTQSPRPVAVPAPAAVAPSLSDDDWAGLIPEGDAPKPTPVAAGPGLTSREFFELADNAGLDRKEVTKAARRMFGDEKWKITELSGSERAALWYEIEPDAAA